MGGGNMEIIEERRRSREKIIGRVSSWVRELPFKVTAIVVGSYARGDFNLWSDVDVLLISRDFKGSPLDRLMEIDVPPGFQVIPLTPEEYRRQAERGNPLVLEAEEKGVVVKHDEDIFSAEQGE